MRVTTETNTYLSLKDEYGKIRNEQCIICSKSGYGKGLAMAGILEKFHKAGYIVLCIADPKDELEFCYQMFEPTEKYHLNHLMRIGKKPEAKKVEIYHPFTFNIPKGLLPDINFYTLSLKNLGRKEWGFLAETEYDTEAVKLLIRASQSITNEDGLYGILHYIQNAIKGKSSGKKRKPDPKNFLLESGSGTTKSVTEISNYLQPFKRDYFLCKDNSPLKLDWKKILTNQESYHVFVSNWVRDEKTKDLLILAILNGIIENKSLLKKPVIISIPELKKIVPFRPEGHKKFLSLTIKDCLSTMRSSGRGMSSLSDSQTFSGIDKEVRDSSTSILFGELGSDGEQVSKIFQYKREVRDQLKKMDYPNSYLLVGQEDVGGFTLFFPSACWAEPTYNFFEKYKQEYGEKMKRYDDVINNMKKMAMDEEDKFKEKMKRKEKAEKERKEKEEAEKEARSEDKTSGEEKVERAKKIEDKSKQKMMQLCYEMKNDEKLDDKDKTFRKIGKKLELNHITVKKYIEEHSKLVEEQKEKEEETDFQDKVIEELNEDELQG